MKVGWNNVSVYIVSSTISSISTSSVSIFTVSDSQEDIYGVGGLNVSLYITPVSRVAGER